MQTANFVVLFDIASAFGGPVAKAGVKVAVYAQDALNEDAIVATATRELFAQNPLVSFAEPTRIVPQPATPEQQLHNLVIALGSMRIGDLLVPA